MAEPVPLLPRHRALADRLVAEGRYAGDWDVIAHAMGLLEDRERLREMKLAELDAMTREGLADAAAGRTYPAEEVFAEIRAMIARKQAEQERSEMAAE